MTFLSHSLALTGGTAVGLGIGSFLGDAFLVRPALTSGAFLLVAFAVSVTTPGRHRHG